METISLRRKPDGEGLWTVPIPDALRDKELEILVVLQPVPASDVETLDERGWPVDLFEETYGSLADDPIERLPQGELEAREAVEFGTGAHGRL